MTLEKPALYVVPTPLGNLEDITRRALEVLAAVDVIAAEDTRHTRVLLSHLGIETPLLAAHEHNEEAASASILKRLKEGQSIALVSDAGTPAISDPGARIVANVREAGFLVIPLPGACALTTALSASGLQDPHFFFYGFLPAKAKAKEAVLREWENFPHTLIFYEAPHRILETVALFSALFGASRRLVLAKELTKLYETIHVATPEALYTWLIQDENRQRGEFVLLLSGKKETQQEENAPVLLTARQILQALQAEGLPTKQMAKIAHALTGHNKKDLYEAALNLGED